MRPRCARSATGATRPIRRAANCGATAMGGRPGCCSRARIRPCWPRRRARAPVLGAADRINSTRQFMHALNRVGVTSAIDAGGDGLAYPDDYAAVIALARRGELTTRIAYALGARHAGREIDDFAQWIALTSPGDGDAFLRANGEASGCCFRRSTWGIFSTRAPSCPRRSMRNWPPSSGCWSATAGRSGCMRPTTNRSAASSTCSRR